jgi:hypothetical protein
MQQQDGLAALSAAAEAVSEAAASDGDRALGVGAHETLAAVPGIASVFGLIASGCIGGLSALRELIGVRPTSRVRVHEA